MTDHGTNMFGAREDLIRQIYEAYENIRCLKPAVVHHIIHQELPCRKYLSLSCVNEPLGSVLNFTFMDLIIISSMSFCQKSETEYSDMPYCTSLVAEQ